MYLMSVSPSGVCREASAIQGLAILNYDIIEWEACVIIMIFFITVAVESTAVMSIMLQELLKEILLEGLTTMLLPCTSVQGVCIIAQLFEKVNSTLCCRVLKSARIYKQFIIYPIALQCLLCASLDVWFCPHIEPHRSLYTRIVLLTHLTYFSTLGVRVLKVYTFVTHLGLRRLIIQTVARIS